MTDPAGRFLLALAAVAISGMVLTACSASPDPAPSPSSTTPSATPSATPTEEPVADTIPGSEVLSLSVTGQAVSTSGETLDARYELYQPTAWDSADGQAIRAWMTDTGPLPEWADETAMAQNNTMLAVVQITATLTGTSWPYPGEIGISLGPGDAVLYRSSDLGVTSSDFTSATLDGATRTRAVVGFAFPGTTAEELSDSSWTEFYETWGMIDLSGSDLWDFNPARCVYEPSEQTAGLSAVQAWGFYNDNARCFVGILQ